MKRLLELGQLTTDMDCALKHLRNIGGFDPVPEPLVGIDDLRLQDDRLMLPGTIHNVHVASYADIQQHKLKLDGSLPPNYLIPRGDELVFVGALPGSTEFVTGDDGLPVTVGGTVRSPFHAVPGDMAQFKAEKGQPNGYVPLDNNGRMPIAHYPIGAGSGTVTFFGLDLAQSYLIPEPDEVRQGSVVMDSEWFLIAPTQWLGRVTGAETEMPESLPPGTGPNVGDRGPPGRPEFTSSQFYPSMIRNLDAAKITSGVFAHQRLPIARGVGPEHAPGAVPDPGPDPGFNADDFLGRNMEYQVFRPDILYQPRVPKPTLFFVPAGGISGPTPGGTPTPSTESGSVIVTISDSLAETKLFWRLAAPEITLFRPYTEPFFIARPAQIEAYGAKLGYNNSNHASLVIPEE